MSRLRSFLTDSRTLAFIGIAAAMAFFFLGAKTLKIALLWAAIASGIVILLWLVVWAVRRRRARRAADELGAMLEQQGDRAKASASESARSEIAALQTRMQAAVKTIKGSRLGQTSGSAALYELPWYITIGNPAAGKSTAIVNSGLTFPFDDGAGNVIKGIGGTRNCDWFFTTEGILLDTAGRYSVHEEDRAEWLGFLGLLKKHRPRAPINGIIVTVSIGELVGNSPGFAMGLAKNLRQRVQELTEQLAVFAPVYVMFTKADLIPGFHDFFHDLDWNERDRVWGATLPYDPAGGGDAIAQFDHHFDALYEGLRALSVAQMSRSQGESSPPGLLTFPSEFAGVKPALKAFLATLFEENPFPCDLSLDLTIRGTGNADSDRARRTMPWHSNNTYIMAEVFPAELRADADLASQFQDLFLEFDVAEGASVFVARCWKGIEISTTGQFDGLERRFCRGPTDHDRQVIGRACSRSE